MIGQKVPRKVPSLDTQIMLRSFPQAPPTVQLCHVCHCVFVRDYYYYYISTIIVY